MCDVWRSAKKQERNAIKLVIVNNFIGFNQFFYQL